MNTTRERWYRIFLYWWLLGFIWAAAIQAFMPEMVATHTIWGSAPGWQHEISIWNVFAIMTLIGALRAKIPLGKTVIPALCVLFALLGTNHLFSVLREPDKHGFTIVILNFVPLLAVALLLAVTRKQSR